MQQRPSQLVNSIDVRESESLESRVCVDYEGGGNNVKVWKVGHGVSIALYII